MGFGHNSQHMFITFEGIDGSGKTTQWELLADHLRRQGVPCLQTRQPGGTELGQAFRQILLHHEGFLSDRCELFLYFADRAQHVTQAIRPALEAGEIVLCDRYTDSTMAYQGGGRGLSLDFIQTLNAFATQGLMPEKTFLFDGPVEALLHRAKTRSEQDRLEGETVDFYERIRQQYLALAHMEPSRFVVIDATQSVAAIQIQVFETLQPFLSAV